MASRDAALAAPLTLADFSPKTVLYESGDPAKIGPISTDKSRPAKRAVPMDADVDTSSDESTEV